MRRVLDFLFEHFGYNPLRYHPCRAPPSPRPVAISFGVPAGDLMPSDAYPIHHEELFFFLFHDWAR